MATTTLKTSDQYVQLPGHHFLLFKRELSKYQGQYILQFQVQVRGKQRKLLIGTIMDLPLMERGKHRM